MAINTLFTRLSISFILYFSLVSLSNAVRYGVLVSKSRNVTNEFCAFYFPEFKVLPEDVKGIMQWGTVYFEDEDLCTKQSLKPLYSQDYVIAPLGNCSLEQQASVVHNANGIGLILRVEEGTRMDSHQVNESLASSINIIVAAISNNSSYYLKSIKPLQIGLYSPGDYFLDYSLLIVWVISMLAITIGSYWSGIVRHSLRKSPHAALTSSNSVPPSINKMEEESALDLSPRIIVFYVFIMGTILILLYFFYSYLVYVILTLFVSASILSLYGCLEPIIQRLKCATCKFSFYLGIKGEVWQVFLLMFSIAVAITWVVYRKHPYSWILQNLLGVFFCINMLKSIRLPSYKICTVLLCLLFIYDIFFVFITPFFTMVLFSAQKGESVMVQVATGGKSEEQLPMVFRVPHTRTTALALCRLQQFSILGYGDILVPGLLVSYCHGFDLLVGASKKPYYILTTIAYGCGMVITFIALYLMATPQPALLYLVPAILFPPMILAWKRGEFKMFWTGEERIPDCLEVVESSPVLTEAMSK